MADGDGARKPSPKRPRPWLLVVDDEPLNRDLLRRALHSEYHVIEAEDADAAWRVLAAGTDEPVRAVLCDQLMPGRSGTDLAADVRARWPDTRFLLLTGYDDDPDVRRAHRDGLIDEVVTKPWSARALKQLLMTVLDR